MQYYLCANPSPITTVDKGFSNESAWFLYMEWEVVFIFVLPLLAKCLGLA